MKPSLPLAAAFLWAMLVPAAGPTRAQDNPPPAIPAPSAIPTAPVDASRESLPGNVSISSGAAAPARASDRPKAEPTAQRMGGPQFLGAASCSSSLCHGGGSPERNRNSYTIWKQSDPHRLAMATLSGTRAARIAQGIAAGGAAASARCTECHIPLATVATKRLAAGLDPKAEGVSCESCHGPSQNWVRSHTRPDLTHAQNVRTGVRELRDLYARANACVACHQVIASDLLTAGHPPLVFELDAQTEAEPRHWLDRGEFFGPRAWLTGQAVALRELSWSLSQDTAPAADARAQWRGLVWLLQRTAAARGGGLPGLDEVPGADDFTPGNVARAQTGADELARAAARLEWNRATVRRCLDALAGEEAGFGPATDSDADLAARSRAQRLALALSRLLAPLQKTETGRWDTASRELDKLFASADARVTFDGGAFVEQLRRFRAELSKVPD